MLTKNVCYALEHQRSWGPSHPSVISQSSSAPRLTYIKMPRQTLQVYLNNDFGRLRNYLLRMDTLRFEFDNSYAKLPERFYSRIPPTKVKKPQLVMINEALADSLALNPDALRSRIGTSVLAGNHVPDGAEPLAMAYAGHQFGGFVPQLGDGRAILLGEIIDRNEVRQDIHLKGAGRTPYSRGGDGRAPLGPVLREYIVSSFMNMLSIPTTRSLAVATTGEAVYREDVLPGAILARVADSHLRIGTFEYFAVRRDIEALQILTSFAIKRHFPEFYGGPHPAKKLLESVLRRQSKLVAKWISVGFVHGVMNTDNTSIAGETIDYGPCAFMDTYRSDKVFSSIDHAGRYAFMNQPDILQWNLAQLAQCLLPLIDEQTDSAVSIAKDIIGRFPEIFAEDLGREFGCKLGLTCEPSDTLSIAFALLDLMSEYSADFTLSFRYLADAVLDDQAAELFLQQFDQPAVVHEWLSHWRSRVAEDNGSPETAQQKLLAANPAVIARNHLVEEVIRFAEDRGDFAPLHNLMAELKEPFKERPYQSKYAKPPSSDEEVKITFCGT